LPLDHLILKLHPEIEGDRTGHIRNGLTQGAVAAIVLLIACANVANLLLVRAEGRQHELAIRAALGAGWLDIARELLMESVALGLLGGVLGLGLAYGAVQVLIAMAPAHLPRLNDISIGPAVILFTLATALVTGVLFGMIPVIRYAGPRIANAGGRRAGKSSGGRILSAADEQFRG
jgi:putative ABC transport system permease protein